MPDQNLYGTASLSNAASNNDELDCGPALVAMLTAQAQRLKDKRGQGYHGWRDTPVTELLSKLNDAIARGRWVDAANFIAFIHAIDPAAVPKPDDKQRQIEALTEALTAECIALRNQLTESRDEVLANAKNLTRLAEKAGNEIATLKADPVTNGARNA